MHILFTDTHPRRIAEATRTDDLQSALDDVIRTLQAAARMFDSRASIPINYDGDIDEHHQRLAEWSCLSRSNWQFMSNVASMLLFEIAFRVDRRRRKKKNTSLITGDRSFDDYKKAVNWSATDIPINLPENGFFDVPFVLDRFYFSMATNNLQCYRLAYADKGLKPNDLDDRDVPEWCVMSLLTLIARRKQKLAELTDTETDDK